MRSLIRSAWASITLFYFGLLSTLLAVYAIAAPRIITLIKLKISIVGAEIGGRDIAGTVVVCGTVVVGFGRAGSTRIGSDEVMFAPAVDAKMLTMKVPVAEVVTIGMLNVMNSLGVAFI